MQSRWDMGESVRVIRNVRNDGTYPGAETGSVLIVRGSVGAVVDIGTFLQDQIIYSVHFLAVDRVVGCREDELVGGDEPWVAGAFETRERVLAGKILALGGDHRVPRGAVGEVLRVMCDDAAGGVVYHVHFDCLPGRTLAVPESALATRAETYNV
jgi:nitrogen fixation protein NifZ